MSDLSLISATCSVRVTTQQKLQDLREDMARENVDAVTVTALDEIAWLLNLRGCDIPCNPVFVAYCVVTRGTRSEGVKGVRVTGTQGGGSAALFVDSNKLTPVARAALDEANVSVEPYGVDSVAQFLNKVLKGGGHHSGTSESVKGMLKRKGEDGPLGKRREVDDEQKGDAVRKGDEGIKKIVWVDKATCNAALRTALSSEFTVFTKKALPIALRKAIKVHVHCGFYSSVSSSPSAYVFIALLRLLCLSECLNDFLISIFVLRAKERRRA